MLRSVMYKFSSSSINLRAIGSARVGISVFVDSTHWCIHAVAETDSFLNLGAFSFALDGHSSGRNNYEMFPVKDISLKEISSSSNCL